MRIRTKLHLSTAAAIVGALAVGIILFRAVQRLDTELGSIETVDRAVGTLFDLNILTHELMTAHTQRVARQWEASHRQVGRILTDYQPVTVTERRLIQRMMEHHYRAALLFERLLEVSDTSSPKPVSVASNNGLTQRLVSQITIVLRTMTSESEQLYAATYRRITRLQKQAVGMAVVCSVGMALVVTCLAALIGIGLVKPLSQLREGIQIVGNGNLEHTVGTEKQDEIGDLSRTFDIMTERLRHTMASRDELAAEIQERKKAQKELQSTLQDLKRSNAELEQFAYVASHDLQEPLRMVNSYVQLLARRYEGKLDEDADKYIGFAVDGATRMQALINDLLTYSRVGTRAKPLKLVDCNSIVDQALKNLELTIREAGADITCDSMPAVHADSGQLVQVFQNLVANAVKFRGDTPPRIHIGVEDDGDTWRFSVQDNGIGIEPKYANRIFAIFQRLHSRTEFSGTGIGLAVCKKIVERHGGTIWLDTTYSDGTRFYFTLPKEGQDAYERTPHTDSPG
ncbi:MAG: HAMP domain-containing protein [Candidatus Pacebacteria bacterium]|nr:HAMP domain-containing protein [Candidatus Paceibacterota bacterium]